MQQRALQVEVGLRHLAGERFTEISIQSVTETLAGELARPLPYPVAEEDAQSDAQ